MKQWKLLVIICLALCLLVPCVYANVVSITPASDQHQVGETQSYDVILDSATAGLSGFNITITVQNPSVARITGVSFNTSWASMPKNSTVPASSIWCKAVDFTGASGTVNISLFKILVRAENSGTTNIMIIPEKVEDRMGGRYTPSVVPGTLTVLDGNTPVANFNATPKTGTVLLTVKFTDYSTNTPTSWNWNFGDGTNSTLQHPVHTYVLAGNHTVTLTASNAVGTNITVKDKYITIYPKGDFNHNWRVDVGDVSLVAFMVVNRVPHILPYADFNNNGFVDIGDAGKIAYYEVKKIPAL